VITYFEKRTFLACSDIAASAAAMSALHERDCDVVDVRCAREPKSDMTDAKRLHQLYTEELQRRLAARGVCSRLEYTGSAYEGVKVRRNVDDSDLEFDIMVILRSATELQVFDPESKMTSFFRKKYCLNS